MRLSENPGRLERWVYRHASSLVGLLVVVIVPLAGVTIWLVYDEIQQGKKLRGVEVVGPCRALGIRNNECQKQARRIFAACYIQHEECWDKYGLPEIKRPIRQREVPDRGDPAGGDASQPGSTGHQQPGPRRGGKGSGGVGAGRGEGDDPSAPPSTGSDPAPESPSGGGEQAPVTPSPGAGQQGSGSTSLPPSKPVTDQVTETAGEAVGGVTETAKKAGCELTGIGC
jgi:hypothetical protein